MDALDVLIARALQTKWGNAAPSPQIWQRIRRHVASIVMGFAWNAHPVPYSYYRMDVSFPMPLFGAGSLLLWRYDFMLVRFA